MLTTEMSGHSHRISGRSLAALLASATTSEDARRIRIGVLVFAGYYIGARLGLALTFQLSPISALWPPNSILFAAMVMVPPRHWWVVAAGAFPAHLISEVQSGIPLAMALCWYVSNVAEAAAGAGFLRLLAGDANPFLRTRGVMLFVLVTTVAVVLASFIDSAFVRLNNWGTQGYWEMWSSRVLSNITAHLVFVPTIVTWTYLLAKPARAGAPRLDEAMLLGGGLAIATLALFNTGLVSGVPAAQVCLPLPFLMWAAFRFGIAGATASFSIVALITIWGTAHGFGALATRSQLENAHSVQLFLLCVGPALLVLAASMEERRRSLASLLQSEKRFEVVLEATRDAIYERDIATGDLTWNREGASRLGHSDGADLDTFAMYANLVHAEDRARWLDQQQQALRKGEPHWESEYRVRRRDGSYANVQEHGFVVRDFEGNPVQMIGALTDVTERRATEELGHRLAQASRLTAMGELTASIAHEINQPLSAILNNVDAAEVLLDSGRLERAELREILNDIRDDDLRADEIIRHIRGLANKRGVDVQVFDVNLTVQAAIGLVHQTALRRGVKIHATYSQIPKVRGDPIHVKQVLLNLMFNAMDAMSAVPAGERDIHVSTAPSGADSVRLSVRDRGHGVPETQMERIFDSFFTTKSEGMGLGLSISRSLVAANGGRIWAQNNGDQGATVSFTLPVQGSQERPA
jgi:two-component system, LuxR family, sensor kinase FixL